MKRPMKVFMIAMCVLLALGLICIGVGVVLGGDFGAVINGIAMDLYARVQGIAIQVPDVK